MDKVENPFVRYWPGRGPRPWWGPAFRDDGVEVKWSERADSWMLTIQRTGHTEYRPTGRPTREESLAYIDHEFPRPAPEPMVGQVWRSGSWEVGVAGALRRMYSVEVYWSAGMEDLLPERKERFRRPGVSASEHPWSEWPPKKALLVYGPGAPWAPADWIPPEEGETNV